tara:strand:+ start:7499 stop:8086 length:588 start_codon:yes stop_codon:yes gene_type:complete
MNLFKILFAFLLLTTINACTNANKSEENLKKLDKIYGYCDNPHRNIPPKQYETCIAKQDAAGPDGEIGEPIDISEVFDRFNNRSNNNQVTYFRSINADLWQGTMDVLSPYSLKLIDSEVGYVETDWIYEKDIPNKRCLIKVQITSVEIISTGVSSKLTCQSKEGDSWYNDQKDYFDQEKKLTLTILSKAKEFSVL